MESPKKQKLPFLLKIILGYFIFSSSMSIFSNYILNKKATSDVLLQDYINSRTIFDEIVPFVLCPLYLATSMRVLDTKDCPFSRWRFCMS